MTTKFAFITYGGDHTQTPADRSRVRSHCMKGRNKREESRRSNREARQAAKQVVSTGVDISDIPVIRGRSSSATTQGQNAISRTVLRREKPRSESLNEDPWARPPKAPRDFVFGAAVDEFANAVGQMPESLMRQCKAGSSIGSHRLTSI
jgi:hypothetical protein